MRTRWFGWLVFLATLAPGLAQAEDFEEFGFGARSQGMAGTGAAFVEDATATYYNPALLVRSRRLSLNFGFSFADYALEFDSVSGGPLDDAAERIPDLAAFSLGVSSTIPWDIPDRFAFGLAVFLPTRGLIDLEVSTQTGEPEWFSYGRRHDRLHILLGGAVKLTDWLSFGAGASVFVDAKGQTTISAGVSDPLDPQFDLKLKPDAGVVVGALLAPTKWLSFGLTYRSQVSFKIDFPANAIAAPITTIDLLLETISFFTPHQFQFGVALNLSESILLTFDFLWSNWSAYDDPFLVESSGVAAVPTRLRVDLDDVFSPRLGIELAATDWLTLRGGYWYRSDRVPDQSFLPTNLADSDRHTFTLGATFGLGEAAPLGPPPEEGEEPEPTEAKYLIDLFFQWHLHPGDSATKAAGDPIGNWDADGSIVNLGFNFTSRF